jgi:hypothetical protein
LALQKSELSLACRLFRQRFRKIVLKEFVLGVAAMG